MTASARITIEHTSTGTLVFGTEKGDPQAHDALRNTGFKWSTRQGFWYLNSQWREPTRRNRVERLQQRLTTLGRDHALQVSDHWRTAPAEEPEPTALWQLSDIEQAIVRSAVDLGAGVIANNAARDQTDPRRIDTVAQILQDTWLGRLSTARGGYLVAQAAREAIIADPSVMDREVPNEEMQQILQDRRARAELVLSDAGGQIGDHPWDEDAIALLERAFHQAQLADPGHVENDETKWWGPVHHRLQQARQQLTYGSQPLQSVTELAPAPATVTGEPQPPAQTAPSLVQEALPFAEEPTGDQAPDPTAEETPTATDQQLEARVAPAPAAVDEPATHDSTDSGQPVTAPEAAEQTPTPATAASGPQAPAQQTSDSPDDQAERAPDTEPILATPPDAAAGTGEDPPENQQPVNKAADQDQTRREILADLAGRVDGLTADMAGVRQELGQLHALVDAALLRAGNPTPVKGSGRVERAVQILDDAYDAVRPHLQAIATSPHVQWLKETRGRLTRLWDKAVALSEKAFAGLEPRLRRATSTAASLMYTLADKIAPRLPDNPVVRRSVELFKLGAALVAQSTRDANDDSSNDDNDAKVGRISRALTNVRRSVPDVESLPGGRDLLAMIEAVRQAQATAQALPARVSRELDLPRRVGAVVSVTAEKIADRAERLAKWLRSNGRDEQQVNAMQSLAHQSREVAEQPQRAPREHEQAIAAALETPAAPVPGSVRSTTVASVLTDRIEQRLEQVLTDARKAAATPMPSTADSTVEDLTARLRERAAAARRTHPDLAGPDHARNEPPSVVHTRDLHTLAADLQRLGIAANAFSQAKAQQEDTGRPAPGLQKTIDEVYQQIDIIQRRRQAARPAEQPARERWATDERPQPRAVRA